MMKNLIRWSFLLVSCLLLTSCLFGQYGYIHNRSNDYLSSNSDPALQMPAQQKLASNASNYPIPAGKKSSQAPSLVPPGNPDLSDPDER